MKRENKARARPLSSARGERPTQSGRAGSKVLSIAFVRVQRAAQWPSSAKEKHQSIFGPNFRRVQIGAKKEQSNWPGNWPTRSIGFIFGRSIFFIFFFHHGRKLTRAVEFLASALKSKTSHLFGAERWKMARK